MGGDVVLLSDRHIGNRTQLLSMTRIFSEGNCNSMSLALNESNFLMRKFKKLPIWKKVGMILEYDLSCSREWKFDSFVLKIHFAIMSGNSLKS